MIPFDRTKTKLTQTNYSGFYGDLVCADQPILQSTHFEGVQTIEIHGKDFTFQAL
jgi:hypothetical protein